MKRKKKRNKDNNAYAQLNLQEKLTSHFLIKKKKELNVKKNKQKN